MKRFTKLCALALVAIGALGSFSSSEARYWRGRGRRYRGGPRYRSGRRYGGYGGRWYPRYGYRWGGYPGFWGPGIGVGFGIW